MPSTRALSAFVTLLSITRHRQQPEPARSSSDSGAISTARNSCRGLLPQALEEPGAARW
jgi:hypothetical protein